MPNHTEERLLGVDAVRFFSFLAILCFHAGYALWGPDGFTGVVQSPWILPFEIYARSLVFSGFTIVFISFFLYGFKAGGSGKWKYLWILLLVFLAVWTYSTEEITDWWDIYQFLLATVIAVSLARFFKLPPKILAFASFIVVSIPFWKLEGLWPQIPKAAEAALWGNCLHEGARADWPLLPWLAYPLLAYAMGRLVRENRADFAKMERSELAVWILFALGSIPFLGGYYASPLGTEFGCYVFRRPPLEFWAHQIWIWFFIRLSLTGKVQERLNRSRSVHWISRRPVNRRFFLIYFIHFPLAFLAASFARGAGVAYAGFTYFAVIIAMILALEALPVVIGKISAKIRF